MKFKSPIISSASRSIGGTTYSRNRYGMYIRNRAMPVNPNTAQQQAVRNRLANLTARWRDTLTAAQRQAWDDYAAATPVTDVLGQIQTITGLNWYMGCNSLRLAAGVAEVDDGPVDAGLADLTLPSGVPDESSSNVALTFDNTDAWAGEVGGHLLLFASHGVAPSINFYSGGYRYAGKVDGAVVPPTSPATINLPFPVNAGQRVFFRAVAVRADGRKSAPALFRGTVQA